MDLIIDLLNEKRDKKNLGLEWNVEITKPKRGFFSRFPFVRSHQHIEKTLTLGIQNLKVDPEIVCDKEKLFTLIYAGHENTCIGTPITLKVEKEKTPFQLFIDQNAIHDCNERQQRDSQIYNIRFDVVLNDREGKLVDSQYQSINVKFMTLDVKPNVKLELDVDNIAYSSQLGMVKVGELVTYIEEEFLYTPMVNLDLDLKLFEDGAPKVDTLFFENRETRMEIQQNPSRKAMKILPIYMDFTRISNPINPECQYVIEVGIVQSMEYSVEVKVPRIPVHAKFFVQKDNQGTELKVEVRNPITDKKHLMASQTCYRVDRVGFVPHSRMHSQIEVDIMNIATDSSNPNAGLAIRNFTLSENVLNGVRVVDKDNCELFNLISVEGVDYDDLKGGDGLDIKNGVDAKTTLAISFDPSCVADILQCPSYDFQIESILTFDYWENKDGIDLNQLEAKNFKLSIVWNLHLDPYPEWLCVDYGTSAIVCKYDKKLIDLKSQKDKIFRTDFTQFRNDEFEKGTEFLSSDIVLHSVDDYGKGYSSLCSEQKQNDNLPYNTLAVCLSPTSSLIENEVKLQLPCLKILVGNLFLPPKPDYLTFKYLRKSVDGVVERVQVSATQTEENSILKISTIFREAYSALFRYFISPVTGDNSRLNKLVLTYPNTYTPIHLKVLRQIAMSTFPAIREGFLRFVSESDAVAAYYVDHWSEFNPEGDIRQKETVLVFDMGAGTLDVTLFDKFTNDEGKIEVNIKGKLGTGKAGNYLDFVLAEILSELTHTGSADVVTTKQVPNVQILKERLELKQVIKQDLKCNLQPGNEMRYKGVTIDMDAIICHPKFLGFLNDVTSRIIDQLCQYMGREKLAIDTVIMSGRSCKLQLLRDELAVSVAARSTGGNHFVEFADDAQADRQKTVVVEGAIAQASKFNTPTSQVIIKSRRLYASYGVVYKELGGRIKYVELLNHNNIPDAENMVTFDSENVTAVGTSAAETLHLIQTFLSAAETEKCYNDGNFEFISEMEEFNTEDFGRADSLNMKLRLDYNNNISLFVNGKVSRGSTPKGVDLASEITRRSIWPVTI